MKWWYWLILFSLTACSIKPVENYTIDDLPDYNGHPFVVINSHKTEFDHLDKLKHTNDYYSPLDSLGRCGYCVANLSLETMPKEPRGPIGMIRPSGWKLAKYDFIEGGYLFNRCHLIGYQLTGVNADVRNLITGTRYFNIEGMLPFENEIAQYIRTTHRHVYYEVTPIFKSRNLVASGVQLEALSVEDKGRSIKMNVFVYNVQPGVKINYKDGSNCLDDK